jgi:Domain of unknown function (DUF4124)
MVAALVALTAAFAVPASQAESVYKSTLPDGHVVYGNTPAKGAAKVQKLEPAAPVVEVEPQAAEAQRQREKAQAGELDKRLAARQSAREKTDAAVRTEEGALVAAEKALAAGREALPGERMATADGGSRLSEGHFERLKSLENDVKVAQERLDKARRERNELH